MTASMLSIHHKTHQKTLKQLHHMAGNRKRYRTALHLITGNIGLNYYLHKINRSPTPICPSCEDSDETVEHILGKCPAYTTLRREILNTYYGNLRNIFMLNSLNSITEFAHRTGRLNIKKEVTPHSSGVTLPR